MEALFYAIIMVQILRYLNRVHNGAAVEFIHKKSPLYQVFADAGGSLLNPCCWICFNRGEESLIR